MSTTTVRLDPGDLELVRGSEKRAFVVVLGGDRMGEMFALKEGDRTTIGRGLQTDIRLSDEGISRTHAMIEERGGDYVLIDAGSTNGTYANGNRIDEHVLQEGDKIQIGASSVLRFTYHDDVDQDFQRSLYESALRDRLTGLFNRGYFANRLESDVAFALRHDKPLALVFFDVDHFKSINDRFGHQAGDEVLKELAERVNSTTRSEDIFARYGGEEFVLICRDVDAQRALRAAERIIDTVTARPFVVGDAELSVTVSIGVADLGALTHQSAESLLAAADSAMYAAKRKGRGRIELAVPP